MDTATVIAGATVAQVFLVGALVWSTILYVRLTGRLAAGSEEQIRMGKTPNLVFEVRDKSWVLINIGQYGILIDFAHLQPTAGDWTPLGERIVLTDPEGTRQNWFLANWKQIISPNSYIPLRWQSSKAGRYIYTFGFLYGSTGQTKHELTVHLNVDGSDNATIFRQEIRSLSAGPASHPG